MGTNILNNRKSLYVRNRVRGRGEVSVGEGNKDEVTTALLEVRDRSMQAVHPETHGLKKNSLKKKQKGLLREQSF